MFRPAFPCGEISDQRVAFARSVSAPDGIRTFAASDEEPAAASTLDR